MVANECMFWTGEGCSFEIESGVKCEFQTNDLVRGCTAENSDLIDEDEFMEMIDNENRKCSKENDR